MNDLPPLFSLCLWNSPLAITPPPPAPISEYNPSASSSADFYGRVTACDILGLCSKALMQEQQSLPITLFHVIVPLSQHGTQSHPTLHSFVSLLLVTHVCGPFLMSSGLPADQSQPWLLCASKQSENHQRELSLRHVLLNSSSCIWGHFKCPPSLCDPEQLLPLSGLPPGMS